MSNEKNDGGPAFPNVPTDTHNIGSWDMGMTLRDYFAAKAMQGLCMAYGDPDSWPDDMRGTGDHDVVASHAYNMADAMLKAREE